MKGCISLLLTTLAATTTATSEATTPTLAARSKTCRGYNPNYSIRPVAYPSQSLTCNQTGTLRSPQPVQEPPYPNGSCTSSSFEKCRDSCWAVDTCLSFGYDAAADSCSLYKQPLKKQGFRKTSTGKQVYFARRCFEELFVGDYIRNGEMERRDSSSMRTNTGIAGWTYSQPDGDTSLAAPQFSRDTHALGGRYSMAISCNSDSSKSCSCTVAQRLAMTVPPAVYSLNWSVAAYADPSSTSASSMAGVRPLLNNIPDDNDDSYLQPRTPDDGTWPSSPDAVTWYSASSGFTQRADEAPADVQFDVLLPAGFTVLLDSVVFRYEADIIF